MAKMGSPDFIFLPHIFLPHIFLPAFFVHDPSAQKQVFTPFSVLPTWLKLALNPLRSLLPFKLNLHPKSLLEARVILRLSNCMG